MISAPGDTEYNVNHFCSFCGKYENEVSVLAAGPSTCICDGCIVIASEYIKKKLAEIKAAKSVCIV